MEKDSSHFWHWNSSCMVPLPSTRPNALMGPQHIYAARGGGRGGARKSCPVVIERDDLLIVTPRTALYGDSSLALCSAPPTQRRAEICPGPAPKVPANGQAITISGGKLNVPDRPIIPFIEGDGTGPDIWRASARLRRRRGEGLRRQAEDRVDGSPRRREGLRQDSTTGCPTTPSTASSSYLVGIKGPLTTPVGGGIRSLNVALRQMLDLYVCLRPVRYFTGVPSPVKHPEKVDMVIFRENTEDIYAGIEYAAGTPEAQKVLDFLQQNSPRSSRRSASARRKRPSGWQKQLEGIGAPKRERKRARSASASSRSATSAPSGSSTARSATRSSTSARA